MANPVTFPLETGSNTQSTTEFDSSTNETLAAINKKVNDLLRIIEEQHKAILQLTKQVEENDRFVWNELRLEQQKVEKLQNDLNKHKRSTSLLV